MTRRASHVSCGDDRYARERNKATVIAYWDVLERIPETSANTNTMF
jgi:hypothetical protein